MRGVRRGAHGRAAGAALGRPTGRTSRSEAAGAARGPHTPRPGRDRARPSSRAHTGCPRHSRRRRYRAPGARRGPPG